jgi:uncharacterized membrane protein YeiB
VKVVTVPFDRIILREESMSDIAVIVICSATLVLVAAIVWRRASAIGPRERILYDAVALFSVTGIAARSARAMGQLWFSAPFTPIDKAVMMAAFVVGFIFAFGAYMKQRKLLPELAWLGRYYLPFYAMRNVIYFGIAYAYLTGAAEALLRAAGRAPELPIDVLKGTILVALAGYAAFRILNGLKGLMQWASAGGPSFP